MNTPIYVSQDKGINTKTMGCIFLDVVHYDQVDNMVVVPKKNGKIWVCVDCKIMNKVRMKGDFL